MPAISFRSFVPADRAACLGVFDANCPAYFAPNERSAYAQFLDSNPGFYTVCVHRETVVGAYGLTVYAQAKRGRISWIMLDPTVRGRGVGRQMMERAAQVGRGQGLAEIDIAASQKSAPFFARFGAVEIRRTADGWGPGMDRVDMEWRL